MRNKQSSRRATNTGTCRANEHEIRRQIVCAVRSRVSLAPVQIDLERAYDRAFDWITTGPTQSSVSFVV